jgi:hypothetical protein
MRPGDTVRVFDTDTGVIRARIDGNRYEIQLRDGHGATLVAHERHLTVISPATAHGYRYRATDPETARLAAAAAERRLTDNQWLVLRSLVEAGRSGLLDHDHEARNGLKQDTAGKRRGELQELGLVEPTGERRYTPRRSLAGVYRATAQGIAAYQEHRKGAA